MFSRNFSLKDCLIILYILASIVAIIVLAVALGQCNKNCGDKESYCNCFGAQQDGSAGNPDAKYHLGAYSACPREGLAKSYRHGDFLPQFSGV